MTSAIVTPMRKKTKRPAWPWRDYLKPEEAAKIAAAEEAKAAWLKANEPTAGIINRAIQRAKYAVGAR
jgi:hypothetical protein